MTQDSILSRKPPAPLPLSVLTGFLGAGKTSLLNQLLKDPALADTVVLINEFGEIGLDHLLIERVDSDMILLASGCLCCTIRGDLVATLEDLLKRRDNGRMPPFARVIVETTGLADPAPILQTLMYHPYLMLRFRLDGVITVVDAINGAATLKAHDEARRQVAVADRLVIAKSDLAQSPAERAALASLREELRSINPAARVLDAAAGEASAASLLDAGFFSLDGKTADVAGWLNVQAYADARHDNHGHDHHSHDLAQNRHDVNRHDAAIRAFCLTSDVPIAASAFDMFLALLRSAHGPKLLRLKGIVALADDPARPVVIHGVQHVFHTPQRLAAWPDADHRTRMVFIVRDLPRAFVDGLWSALTGGIAPDQPDIAAISANPLKAGAGGLLG